MQARHYKTTLYFIIGVIALTLGTQVYWSYKNYQATKQTLINEVQISLDNTVDRYYGELAQLNTIKFFPEYIFKTDTSSYNKNINSNFPKPIDSLTVDSIVSNSKIESIVIKNSQIYRSSNEKIITNNDSTVVRGSFKKADSLLKLNLNGLSFLDSIPKNSRDYLNFSLQLDTSTVKPFSNLAKHVIGTLIADNLDFNSLIPLFKEELERKKINLNYALRYKGKIGKEQVHNSTSLDKYPLSTFSKSQYLPKNSSLKLYFANNTITILKKNIVGILISVTLIGSVIACLLYLLKIINDQKQLAEIKNDLISNITHEFKTPIATIHTAIESIQSFNDEAKPEKTKNYLAMSSQQLGKLNTMVEKLLETATLDSNALVLQKEEINLVNLMHQLAVEYKEIAPDKEINLIQTTEQLWITADAFHLENALDNIIVNAIKYGGNQITIKLEKQRQNIHLIIEDSGTDLTKAQAALLFEKFYRVPKGNTHNVKGFGIGLFYTKSIIERHDGTIAVSPQPNTQFKINLPYV